MSAPMTYSSCEHTAQMANFSLDSIIGRNCCQICFTSGPNLWVCVTDSCDLFTGCGEGVSDHSTQHYRLNRTHRLALNSTTFRIWCYECQTEVFVDNQLNDNNIYLNNNNNSSAGADTDRAMTTDAKPILANQVYVADITEDDTEDEEELLIDNDTKPRGLTGLQNLGNSCYMNAALQSLSNCPQLTRFMLDCHSYVRKPGIAKTYCRLIKEIWDNRRPSYVVPTGIAHGIKSIFPLFRGYTQQDAQEFLRCFLDQLHEELKDTHFGDTQCSAHGNEFCANYSNNCINVDINTSGDNINSDSETNSDADYETCDSGLSSEKSTFGGEGEDEPDMNGITIEGMSLQSNEIESNDIELKSRTPTPTIGSSISSSTALQSPSIGSGNSNTFSNSGQSLGTHSQSPKQKSNESPKRQVSEKSGRSRSTPTYTYRSIISDIFDGRILSSVQCLKCDNVSTTRETFQDLSLPIPSREQLLMLRQQQHQHQQQQQLNQLQNISQSLNSVSQPMSASLIDLTKDNVTGIYSWLWEWIDWFMGWILGPTVTLQDCLSAFFSADELRGDNMYSCEKCKKLRNGVKYSKVLELPEILSVHLKRFRHELLYSSKIASHVAFPLEGLDMSSYMVRNASRQSNGTTIYDLVAVICHLGTAASGHYTAYALNQYNQVWYEFDDQFVTSVDPQQVSNCDAYVLFYRKSNDEMNRRRVRALELMKLSRSEPSLRQFYVSKQWVNRFNTFSAPGPITNCDFLCQHNAVDPHKAHIVHDLCTIFSHSVWEYFQVTFGGGPVCTELFVCQTCQTCLPERELSDRKRRQRHNKSISSDSFE